VERNDVAGSGDRERFQNELGGQLERIDDPIKIYKFALGRIARHLGAKGGAVILRRPVSGDRITLGFGEAGRGWDDATVSAFLDLRRPELPANEIMAPILIGGRAAGLMALRRRAGTFEPGEGRFLARLCRKVAHEAALREERRVNRVVDQIKDKTVRELRPQDLFYQILHGLRALTRYDHSSAILIAEEDAGRLVLHAEQTAWAKRKSDRIGRKIRVPQELRAGLGRASSIRWASFGRPKKGAAREASTARRDEGAHRADAGHDPEAVARLLRWGGKHDEPAEGTILWAPLRQEGELLGLLKIATRRPEALGAPEAAGVERVVGHLASVIHNARRALSMEERILEAEKKHAMADLARAISHDVKNAIGAILPLAQQAREEVETGTSKPEVLAQDLAQIEQSAQICQRIFDGLLQLARSESRPSGTASLTRALEGTLAILGTRIKRAGVTLEMKVSEDLPEVAASLGGIEQVFLNLFTNALDAMPAGGRLRVQARQAGPRLEVRIADTGAGIPPEEMKRIHEPFYTTKQEGFGLGLAICRSILWESAGEMTVDSQIGRGTTVTVVLPVAGATAAARPARQEPGPQAARAAASRADTT
jgi:two-component system, NtrC family, sensor kinase